MAQRTQSFMTTEATPQILVHRRDALAITARQVNQVAQQVQFHTPSQLPAHWDRRGSFSIFGDDLGQQIRALSLNPTSERIEALLKAIIHILEQMVKDDKTGKMIKLMDCGLVMAASTAKSIPVEAHDLFKERTKASLYGLAMRLNSQETPNFHDRFMHYVDWYFQTHVERR